MQGKQTINSFNKGMVQDIDLLNQPANSYRYSMGGRLMFNDDGTFSWEIENGNKVSITMVARGGADPNKYIPIGDTGNNTLGVLFTVDPLNGSSEIGIFSVDSNGVGTYKTMFNDQDDPNGDTLDFQASNQVEARFVYENDQCIRVYWVDGVANDSNRPRVFTFSYDNTIGPPSDVSAYTPLTTSVHSMNSQTNFAMGLIKYVQRTGGNLLTGIYQYTYRLVTADGYQTPWYPLTRKVFVTSDNVSNTNWNTYEMEGSGIVTGIGNQIEVKGVDERFKDIQVAYVYAQDETVAFEANIFAQVAIDSDSMTFNHITNDGEPIELETIPAIFSGIRAAKTLNIKDATLYYGNVIEGLIQIDDIEPILENLVVTPIYKDMRSDELDMISPAIASGPPITHATTKTGTTTKRLHSAAGGTETYQIIGDYINYKGTQVSHLYPAHFRDETYRYALVFFDLLGFPFFAIHMADVKFPTSSSTEYEWTRIKADGSLDASGTLNLSEEAWVTNNFGQYTEDPVLDGEDTSLGDYSHLRIQGVEFSGIDITTVKSRISGFKIVRVERDPTILLQGLVMPCVREADITRPMVAANNRWGDVTNGPSFGLLPGSSPSDIELFGTIRRFDSHGDRFLIRPNISVYHAPDADFDSTRVPTLQTQDRLKLVTGCFQETNQSVSGAEVLNMNQFHSDRDQCVQKLYYTKETFHATALDPFPVYNAETSMDEIINLGLGGSKPDYVPTLDLENSIEFYDQGDAGFSDDTELKAWGKGLSLFIRHANFGFTANSHAPYFVNDKFMDSPWTGWWIGNYRRPNPNPYGGLSLSALEQSIFFSTGHFQPVNNATFDAQGMPGNDIFDNIEVWGGDCYLDYIGFLRAYPRYWANPNQDTSYLHVFPLESTLNHALRQAPSSQNPISTDVGARPEEEYTAAGSTNWPDGLYHVDNDDELREEFNLNSVLLFEEVTQFFNAKPLNFKDNSRFPVRWRYTREKVYGDPVDTWRIFQVNDFHDLKGQYGEITSSLYIFNQIYSWQLSAFGRLRASDRALIESANAGTLTTGIGDKLDGIDYISTETGNQHQWSLFSSGRAAYWIDANKRNANRFAQDGELSIADLRGLHQYINGITPPFENNDNPAFNGGINGAFDFGNDDVYWTFKADPYLEISDDLIVQSVKRINSFVYKNNETLWIDWQGITSPGVGLILPAGETTLFSSNFNALQYLCMDDASVDMHVRQVDENDITTNLFIAEAGKCYRLFRSSNRSLWQFVEVTISNVSMDDCTVSYNENLDAFHGFHPFCPSYYISHKNLLITHDAFFPNSDNIYWAHDLGLKNQFYGQNYKAELHIVVSEGPMLHKIFDSLRVNCNELASEEMIRYIFSTERQSYFFDVQSDSRQEYLEDILRFPIRTFDQDDRTRGKHCLMIFEFEYNLFEQIRMTNLVTNYRPSSRI